MSEQMIDPVCEFYSRQAERFGPSGVLPHHRARANRLRRIAGEPPQTVLELGSGAGGTALATAALGYAVRSVELSPLRVRYARDLAAEYTGLPLDVQEGDFYRADLGHDYDIVAYWNGFGIGSDDDQRALLSRVANDWLERRGRLIVDVFNPQWWVKLPGKPKVHEEIGSVQQTHFDPLASRFIDRWWPIDHEDEAVQQSIRCYSPPDLKLLLEPCGLEIVRLEIADSDDLSDLKNHPDYLAVVRKR